MKFFATAIVLLTLASNVMGLTINSPSNVVECQPFQFTWSGGTGPFFLSLIPGANQAPIKMFPQQTGNTFTWNVDLQAGTTFTASLKDSTGTQAFSAAATIIAGTSTSCVNTAITDDGSGSGSGSATSGATSGASGAASAATTAASSVPHSSGAASSGAATSSAARSSGTGAATSTSTSSTASKSSGATLGSSVSAFGIAGIFGLVGAALF